MFRTLHDPVDPVVVDIDGVSVRAERGETVAAVLMRSEIPWVRETPISGAPRAPYCMMGVCFECLADVDGVRAVQTCLAVVRDGMVIRRRRRGETA